MQDPLTNARDELLDVLVREQKIEISEIRCADLWREVVNEDYDEEDYIKVIKIPLRLGHTPNELEEFLSSLNFNYYGGFGAQTLFGTVWLTEGRWLARGEYDGSEWWDFHVYPDIPEHLK